MAITVQKDIQVTKQSTDGRSSGMIVKEAFAVTTNNTAIHILSVPIPALSGIILRTTVLGLRDDGTEGIGSEIITRARRAATGNITLIGTNTAVGTAEDSSGTPTVVVSVNTTTQALDVHVTGETSKTFLWSIYADYMITTVTGATIV